MPLRPARLVPAVIAVALVAGACGGGKKEQVTPTTVATTTPSTTEAATTSSEATTTTAEATTTTGAPAPSMPLTGVPLNGAPLPARPALVVKIDNHPDARPQWGLTAADVVFEEVVEGITRFFAVFQSTPANPVGPIRSARTSDLDILPMFSKPLLAWSGGNPTVSKAIRSSDITDIGGPTRPDLYYRERSRQAPHNFLSGTDKLWTAAPAGQGAPAPLFTYRTASSPAPAGQAIEGVKLTMLGTRAEWRWDPSKAGWARFQDGRPHVDMTGVQVAPQNVVIQFTDYKPSFADRRSPEAQTLGKGEAWILTEGVLIKGTWERGAANQPPVYKDANGTVIALTPGRTWVELTMPGRGAVVPAGTDPASVGFPNA